MEKSCETCLYEYACDWTPAGEGYVCDGWVPDRDVEEK